MASTITYARPRAGRSEARTTGRVITCGSRRPLTALTTAPLEDKEARLPRRSLLPPSYERTLGHARRIELASDRLIRERNKVSYRIAHWPIWIWVFFIAPGPTDVRPVRARVRFADGVVAGGGARRHRHRRSVAASCRASSRAPTSSASLRIVPIRCIAASATRSRGARSIAFAVLNIDRARGGDCDRRVAACGRCTTPHTFPSSSAIWLLGAFGQLPRVKRSTKDEGHERRYFYGSVWAVCIAQPILWLLWRVLPRSHGVRSDQAGGVRRHPCLRRQHGAARAAAAHAADRSRRAGRL